MLQSPAKAVTADIPHLAWADTLDGLAAIRAPSTTLAIHPRAPEAVICSLLNHRVMGDFQGLRCEISAIGAELRLEQALDQAGLAPSFGRWALCTDIARLVAVLSRLSGASRVAVRLDRLTTQTCRLFHPDHVPLRLICTYRGPATQWLPDDSADRTGIGSGDNNRICRQWAQVQNMRPFWVGVMKGEDWPDNAGKGLLHRSPPMAEPDWRLFLAMDPIA